MDVLPRITRQLVDLFRTMSPVQRATFATVPALALFGLVWLVAYNRPEDFQPLSFGKSFAAEEIGPAEKALRLAGLTNYRREGQKLLAPANELDRYNAALVEFDAVPSDLGSQILKQFESLGPFSTDRHRQDMKEALLLQELRRMIKAVPDVEDARVAVANSGRRVGFGQKPRVTANVTIKPRAGRDLSSRLVSSLRQAVASMVPDLQPEDVTIFDVAKGQSYSGEQTDDPMEGRLIQRVREYTRQYEQQIQKALSFIPNVTVTVHVDIDNLKSSVTRQERIRVTGEDATTANRPGTIQLAAHGEQLPVVAGFRGHEGGPTDYSREETEQELMAAMPKAVQVSVSIPRDYYRDVSSRRKAQAESRRSTDLDSIEEEVLSKVERTVGRLIPVGSPRDAVSVTTVDRLPIDTTEVVIAPMDQLMLLAGRHGSSVALGLFAIWVVWMLARSSTPVASPRVELQQPVASPQDELDFSANPYVAQPVVEAIDPTMELRIETPPELQRGVPEVTRQILEQPLVPTSTAAVEDRIEQLPDTGPFAFLNGQHEDDIRALLINEHPQTMAVIAAQLPPSVSAAVLAGLRPDQQADVLQRVARLGPTDAEILNDIAEALKDRLGKPRVRAGGIARAAAVVQRSSRPAGRAMLDQLETQDSDLADELRQTLFSFDDLLKLNDDTLRVILQETDDRQWALALKASPEGVRQRVLGCLAPRVSQALKAEMDSLGPVRLSEMTAVRQQIADSIRRLEDAGLIELAIR